MKKVLIAAILVICVFGSSSCSVKLTGSPKSYMGFSKNDFTVVDEADDHGGFVGDGMYRLILNCSENRKQALKNIENWDWKELPLSENLSLIMYGGEKDGMEYGYILAREAKIPQIRNGYYCFIDRHSESTNARSDADLFNRFSFNFSLGMYDMDSDRMYYIAFDT